jgi:type II secretory pathway pseudopilin PulG
MCGVAGPVGGHPALPDHAEIHRQRGVDPTESTVVVALLDCTRSGISRPQPVVASKRATRAGRGDEAGFTMIEVMVAFMLTAVATAGLLGMYSIQARSSVYSRHAAEAAELAQDQLERLRATSAPATVTTGTQAHVDEKGKVTSTGTFSRTWTVMPTTEYCDLVVTVAWNEDGVARQVVMRGRRSL